MKRNLLKRKYFAVILAVLLVTMTAALPVCAEELPETSDSQTVSEEPDVPGVQLASEEPAAPEPLQFAQTIAYGSEAYVSCDDDPGLYLTIPEESAAVSVYLQKCIGQASEETAADPSAQEPGTEPSAGDDQIFETVAAADALPGTNLYEFRYPYNTTSSLWRIITDDDQLLAVIDLTVTGPKVRTRVKADDSSQYVRNTGDTWYCYPVKYTGKGPSNGSTTKDIRLAKHVKNGSNYDIKWDKKHKTTMIAFVLNRLYEGQTVKIVCRSRHRTWKASHESKVITRTVRPKTIRIRFKFKKELLQYENHDFTVTTYVKTDAGRQVAGVLDFHVHVKDKGEQIVDTAARYLGRVNYSNFQRRSVSRSAKSLSWLMKNTPPKCYADCSSFVTWICHLHGLWTGSSGLDNKTASMGPNASRRPADMKRVKRLYKNMGCVWMVNNMESGHMYSHAALIVGNNYYINVTAHDDYPKLTGFKANACYQRCTPGSRNFTVGDVYNYRSW